MRSRLLRLTLMWLVAGVALLVLGHLWWASACLVIAGFHAWAFWAQRPAPEAAAAPDDPAAPGSVTDVD